jgi:hypothetical protein
VFLLFLLTWTSFSWIARKGNVLVTSIFIMGITGTLVTFALREVRSRVVKLTLELQQLRSRQVSCGFYGNCFLLNAAIRLPLLAYY